MLLAVDTTDFCYIMVFSGQKKSWKLWDYAADDTPETHDSWRCFIFSPAEEHSQQIQTRLPLLVGSVMGGAAFLLVVAAIVVVVVFRRLVGGINAVTDECMYVLIWYYSFWLLLHGSKKRESPYSDRLQRYISNRGEWTIINWIIYFGIHCYFIGKK